MDLQRSGESSFEVLFSSKLKTVTSKHLGTQAKSERELKKLAKLKKEERENEKKLREKQRLKDLYFCQDPGLFHKKSLTEEIYHFYNPSSKEIVREVSQRLLKPRRREFSSELLLITPSQGKELLGKGKRRKTLLKRGDTISEKSEALDKQGLDKKLVSLPIRTSPSGSSNRSNATGDSYESQDSSLQRSIVKEYLHGRSSSNVVLCRHTPTRGGSPSRRKSSSLACKHCTSKKSSKILTPQARDSVRRFSQLSISSQFSLLSSVSARFRRKVKQHTAKRKIKLKKSTDWYKTILDLLEELEAIKKKRDLENLEKRLLKSANLQRQLRRERYEYNIAMANKKVRRSITPFARMSFLKNRHVPYRY